MDLRPRKTSVGLVHMRDMPAFCARAGLGKRKALG
jgi:hypothetical protein